MLYIDQIVSLIACASEEHDFTALRARLESDYLLGNISASMFSCLNELINNASFSFSDHITGSVTIRAPQFAPENSLLPRTHCA